MERTAAVGSSPPATLPAAVVRSTSQDLAAPNRAVLLGCRGGLRVSKRFEKGLDRRMSELRSANAAGILLAMLVLLFAYGAFH